MEDYLNSKTPVKLLLIAAAAFAVNLVLVMGFQMLVQYRYPAPVDAELLGRMDAAYEGCVILGKAEEYANPERDLTVYLVQAPDGQEHLVTVRKHFLFGRYRMEKRACRKLDADEETILMRTGSNSFRLNITRSEAGNTDIQWTGGGGGSAIRMAYGGLMFWIVLLCIAELIGYRLLFEKKRTG